MPLCPGRPQRTELRSHPWGMNNPGTREWIALGLRGFSKICEQIFLSSSYMVCPLWVKPTSPHQTFTANPSLCCSVAQSCQTLSTPWTAAHQASLSLTISWSLLKLMSIKSVMPSNHPHPLSSPSPLAFNLSQHQVLFQWVSSSHHVAKVLALQHQSFQWIFRTDFL